MNQAHIYIYGDIGWWQAADSADWGEITLTDVRNQYEAQKDSEEIVVHIHSPGGYVTEGFAIHDYLRSQGKPVTTIIEGMCYSIATVIALAGDVRKMTSNSDFMIHNPWGGAVGESEEIQKYADNLKEIENKVADFYAAKTHITKDEALEMMKAETFMNSEKALEYGFITEIASVMKAVAKYNPNKKKMSKKEDNLSKEEAKNMLDGFQKKMKKLFGSQPKNKIVQDANGTEIDFPDLADDDTPSVGDKATVDGSAASGEHVMPSGETYVFTEGELTEIKPKEEEEEDEQTMDQLKEENEDLKSQLADAKNKLKASEKAKKKAQADYKAAKDSLEELNEEFTEIKSKITSDFNHDPKKNNFGKKKEGKRHI